MAQYPKSKQSSDRWGLRRWLMLLLLVAGVALVGVLIWPYMAFLTDRDELRRLILDAGPGGPLVLILLQMLQVVVAPLPGTVISLVGGYIFEAFWATVYAMIGTTIGFLVVFIISKRYGRSVMKYFISTDKLAKYDEVASSKGAFAFIAVGFLFPFIPDPVLGYIAGTTPIPTRVLMVICVLMRLPGTIMTSLVGSQFGQGNYRTVVFLLVGLAIVLLIGGIFYRQISLATDWLYKIAIRAQAEDQHYRAKVDSLRAERRQLRHRRTKQAVARVARRIKRRSGKL